VAPVLAGIESLWNAPVHVGRPPHTKEISLRCCFAARSKFEVKSKRVELTTNSHGRFRLVAKKMRRASLEYRLFALLS
jgi:hypothetical protein